MTKSTKAASKAASKEAVSTATRPKSTRERKRNTDWQQIEAMIVFLTSHPNAESNINLIKGRGSENAKNKGD
jgi:hypothetical protein